MKTFRANSGNYNHRIDELDYIRETEHFIVVSKDGKEIRESKESSNHRYFTKFDDAKEWLMYQLDISITNAQAQVDRLKSQKLMTEITWTSCAEQMPPDDDTEIILRCYGTLTKTNGMTAFRVHLNPYAGYTKWTSYTEEKWKELNK